MSDYSLDDAMEDLSTAEDFLDFFKIEYEPTVVHVNRLHILQRFHDYMAQGQDMLPETEEARHTVFKRLLAKAYQDFVESNALQEKVFKVFQNQEKSNGFVSLDQIDNLSK